MRKPYFKSINWRKLPVDEFPAELIWQLSWVISYVQKQITEILQSACVVFSWFFNIWSVLLFCTSSWKTHCRVPRKQVFDQTWPEPFTWNNAFQAVTCGVAVFDVIEAPWEHLRGYWGVSLQTFRLVSCAFKVLSEGIFQSNVFAEEIGEKVHLSPRLIARLNLFLWPSVLSLVVVRLAVACLSGEASVLSGNLFFPPNYRLDRQLCLMG